MKLFLGIMATLTSAHLMAQPVPSDLKRQEIKLQDGEVNTHQSFVLVEAGRSQSQSNQKNYSVSPYSGKELNVQLAKKYLIGSTYPGHSSGVAVGPEAKIKMRLDDSGKKMRLELDGKLITLFDMQVFFNDDQETWKKILAVMHEKHNLMHIASKLEQHVAAVKKNDFMTLEEKNHYLKVQEEEIKTLKEKIKDLEKQEIDLEAQKANPKSHGTFNMAFLQLGAAHRDIADALSKFTGFKGTVSSFSFDVDQKILNSNTRVGLCGIFELLTFEAGRFEKQNQKFNGALMSTSASLCARVSLGPIVITNTLTGGFGQSNLEKEAPRDYSINNQARIAYQSKVIPGAVTEIGAGHTYTYEKIGDAKIGTHVIGGGVTVYAK